ncbi:MAG TPA: tetratricopeptide repeat protein, partial [Aggregatilineales bacterium]|nr:tetratricopeptide repeat protein [Aggregatilineales bacterium]
RTNAARAGLSSPKRSILLGSMIIVLSGLAVYHNSFTGPFIFDDVPSVERNPSIHHLWPIWVPLSPPRGGDLTVAGRPIINFSLAVNYASGGLNVRGYHVFNLTVHILAALLLYGIVRRTLLSERLRSRFGPAAVVLALAIAVLWTVHPLQTEAVTYIVQRAESLMGLFYLLTLYCFIRGTEPGASKTWFIPAVAACALGMASKEVMVSAPLVVLLYDRTFVAGTFREAWRQRRTLYLGLASTWLLLGYLLASTGLFGHQAGDGAGATWWRYALTESNVILHYLRLALWPDPLCLDYLWPIANTWGDVLPSTIVVTALLSVTVWACWRKSSWGFLGAWLFLILAPTSSVLPLRDLAFEHRMYLPLAAVIVPVVLGIHELLGQRGLTVLVVAALGLGFVTVRRNDDYRTEMAIWRDTVAKRPGNTRAHANLGRALLDAGQLSEAMAQCGPALQANPDNPEAHYNVGFILQQMERTPEAIGEYEQALRLKPDFASAHYNLGVALDKEGRMTEAMEHYQQALRIDPDYIEARVNLGNAFLRRQDVSRAIGEYEQALRIDPNYAEAHSNLGAIFQRQGKLPEAVTQYEQALQSKPDYAEAHFNLGLALEKMGRTPAAIEHYRQALKIRPDFVPASNALARLAVKQ